MLAIAGGIILAVFFLALLPYVLDFLVSAFFVTLVLIIGAIALLVFLEEPTLALCLVPLLPAWLAFSLLRSIKKQGGVEGWLKYVRIECRHATTANDIANKANELAAHAAWVEEAKQRREEEMVACATTALIAHVERKIARLAPGAPVRIENNRYDHRVFVGDLEIGSVSIERRNKFLISEGGEYCSGEASAVAGFLAGSLRRKLRASPSSVRSLGIRLT